MATIVASASLVASAYIAKDKLVCAKATQSSTFVPGQTTHGDSEAIRNTCAICARSLWPTHNDADICTSCIDVQTRLWIFINSIEDPINRRMLDAVDTREFRHAGARRLRDSEWKDGKMQCLTSQDSEHLEQFLRDELIKHDVNYHTSDGCLKHHADLLRDDLIQYDATCTPQQSKTVRLKNAKSKPRGILDTVSDHATADGSSASALGLGLTAAQRASRLNATSPQSSVRSHTLM